MPSRPRHHPRPGVERHGAIVDRAIIDKQCTIKQNAHVGYGVDYSPNPMGDLTSGISLMGKNSVVPENVRVGRNCVIAGDSQPEDFAGNILTNNQNNRIIGLKLEFYQIQYPKMPVGPGQYYDYYQLHTRITRRTIL